MREPFEQAIVFVVDDDALVRDAIEDLSLDSPLFALYRGAGTAEGVGGWRGRQRGSVNEGGLGTPWPSDR